VAPPTTPDLPGGGTVEAPESDQAPVLAESPAPTSVGTRPTAATTDGGLSTGQRRAIALVVIAAEIAGYALLTRTSAGAAVPAAAVAGMASGRLRPPDRAVGGFGRLRSGDAGAPGGVGRFRRDRQGPAPHL
jgi:hypothetical protein